METWTFIISALALIASLYTYIAHDRALKKQEQKINQYQLRQLEQSFEDNKKAIIKGEIKKGFQEDVRILRISNHGRSNARNIRIEGVDLRNFLYDYSTMFPVETMSPNSNIDLAIYLHSDPMSDTESVIRFIWDDDYAENNELEQHLSIWG